MASTLQQGPGTGLVVAETGLSDVDGEVGRLVIRGHLVEDLVEHAAFEEVCGLLWTGTLAVDRKA